MLIVIDYYAENPIVGKTLQSCYLENSNVYDDINGNGDSDWTISNTNNVNLYSTNLVEITGNTGLTLQSTTGITDVKGSRVDLYATTGINSNPVLSIKSDITPGNHYLDIRRNSNGRIELNPQNANLRFGAYGGEDVEFYMTTGKIKFPVVTSINIQGGTSGQIMTTDGSGNLSWTTASSGGLTTSNFVFNEIPVGLINNVNLNYTLAFIPQANTVQVFVNGLLQKPTTDYTISVTTLTFVTPLQTGDELLVHYIK